MNGRYLYNVGDTVRHDDNQHVKGVIVKQITEDYGPVDELDPDNPWYNIKWEGDEDGDLPGFEHEESLVPGFVNPVPNLFIKEIYRTNRTLWEETLKKVK